MRAFAIAMAEVQEDSVLSGFDWTANQLIIEPAARLATKKEN